MHAYTYKLEALRIPSTSGITQRETCIQTTEFIFSIQMHSVLSDAETGYTGQGVTG